ncbi:MAG: PAS domain S-box protein [Chloroflexota bacterium]|nr:PAS domain S-box protein [Chloroflexota bacterium]
MSGSGVKTPQRGNRAASGAGGARTGLREASERGKAARSLRGCRRLPLVRSRRGRYTAGMNAASPGLHAFHPGDQFPDVADLAYLVRAGRVRLLATLPGGGAAPLALLGPGEAFLPAAGVRATAATAAEVLAVPLPALPALLASSPVLGATAVAGLLRRQAALQALVGRLLSGAGADRLTAALAAEEAGFREAWEAAPEAVALSDPDGVVLAANPAYADLYGYPLDEVVGHSFALIFPPEQRAWALAGYRETFAGPTRPAPVVATVRRADGVAQVVEARVGFVERAGTRLAMVSVLRETGAGDPTDSV